MATDTSGKVVTDFCSAESSTSSTPTSSPSSSATPEPGGGGGLSGGAIAGIVIGSVAGVALIAALAFFLLRRRKGAPAQAPQEAWAQQPGYQGHYAPTHQPGTLYEKPAEPVPQYPPQQHEIYEAPGEPLERPMHRAEM